MSEQHPADDAAPAVAETGPGTVTRIAALLGVLADAEGSVTVKHVAECMQVAPSTAHRLLQLLRKEGFVEALAESRQYAIGPAFYRVAARVVGKVSVAARAQPVIEAVASRFDETVLLGLYMPSERALYFAGRADGQQKLKYQIEMNRPLSLVWGASGKAVLAFLPEETARAILASEGPSPASGRVPPSWSDLAPELARIRDRGWAVSESEKLPDARGIAAPLYGAAGVIGCICLTSPQARLPHASIDAIGNDIATQARLLSRELGAASA